jgi:hypothetical protein
MNTICVSDIPIVKEQKNLIFISTLEPFRGRLFFRKSFFRIFVLAPPQEVLGDEIRNEWYPPTS